MISSLAISAPHRYVSVCLVSRMHTCVFTRVVCVFCMYNTTISNWQEWQLLPPRTKRRVWLHVTLTETITAACVFCEHSAPLQHRLLSPLEAQPGTRTLSPSNWSRNSQREKESKFYPFTTTGEGGKWPVRGCTADKAYLLCAVSGQLLHRLEVHLWKKAWAQDWRARGG